uniref:Putative structural ORF n=1 Tax=Cecropis daurica parvoviridae sp. TaxID=2794470 RepID=A0A8E7G1X9_9VIRU|nr:MAG: putative structural ORF [Cecropis daurica parvoviridae sp.]
MYLSALQTNSMQNVLLNGVKLPHEERLDLAKKLKEQPYEGSKNTGGVTWIGSQFTGPGNKLVDSVTKKSNFTELPKTPVDWATLEHDVDYYNMVNPTMDEVWKADKKAITNSFAEPDLYHGGTATAVGLLAKNALERTYESISGSQTPLYPKPNTSGHHIDWFDKVLSRRRPTVIQGKYGSIS